MHRLVIHRYYFHFSNFGVGGHYFILQDSLRTIYNYLTNSFAGCLCFLGHNLSGLGDLNLFRAVRCSFSFSLCLHPQGIRRPPGGYLEPSEICVPPLRTTISGTFSKCAWTFYIPFVAWFFKKGLHSLSSTYYYVSRQRATLLPMEGEAELR